jgi:hypothetical protein
MAGAASRVAGGEVAKVDRMGVDGVEAINSPAALTMTERRLSAFVSLFAVLGELSTWATPQGRRSCLAGSRPMTNGRSRAGASLADGPAVPVESRAKPFRRRRRIVSAAEAA